MPLPQPLYYNSAAQEKAKTISKIYNFATPAGQPTLTATVGQTLTTNRSPEINNFFAPMYASKTDANAGTNVVAHISYLQIFGMSNDGQYTIVTNNYSIYNDVPVTAGIPDAIQFLIVANVCPLQPNSSYITVPNYTSGVYVGVKTVTVSLDNNGMRSYSFST